MRADVKGSVIAVSADASHRFSKPPKPCIKLIADFGIEGDAHAGKFIQHRYLSKRAPALPNNRQVHLIQSELFSDLVDLGFVLTPGDLGENITTAGIDLLSLPLGSLLHLGTQAVVQLTGLRTPCGYIDRFQKGLKRTMILRTPHGPRFRAGVMSVVTQSGIVRAGDAVVLEFPMKPWSELPALP